ncbi:UMP-CMP kinase [Sistotremastrum niveocremeum HHB9708]|uniref:Uridylate kinase n=2 Tax=Sistotremastraceae TaxID=3402574 RepID=A0A165AN02_9AGAM|nr:UMP-CMP kinase [Sistotremastrum niveocremeum HHB9708]KZT36979.1 UMP-CMP kinase [Sistotremastrum suecicum HHB10207 ss-3]
MPIIEKIADKLHLGSKPSGEATQESATSTSTPVFDHTKVTVIFVLGGPGAGKGTQCAKVVQDYGFVHLSAGDLLRAEQQREGSQYGELIRTNIREGTIVPMEVTVKLLENAMRSALQERAGQPGWENGSGRFLIDGFPRKMDQADKFEETVCPSSLILFFTCTEEILLQRLLIRGETSGREDDNVESIKKRFRTYNETTMPVVEHYESLNKVAKVDGTRSIDEVYVDTRKAIETLLGGVNVTSH